MLKVLDSAFLAKCKVLLENSILFIPEIPHLIGEKKIQHKVCYSFGSKALSYP